MDSANDMVPDFLIEAESQDVIDSAMEDLSEWWNELEQRQQSDYLSAWDALHLGDHARAGCYDLVCVGSYAALGYVRFKVTTH